MPQGFKEAWITAVYEDDSVFSALALAQSIRETCSFKEIVALYGPKMSPSKRDLLNEGFDKVVPVLFERLSEAFEWNTYAKIFCWSITDYRKIVFLDQNSLVLKNGDELFEKESFAVFKDKKIIGMSLIPSIAKFHEFAHEFATKNGFAAGGAQDVSLEKLCRQAGFIKLKKSDIYSMQNGEIPFTDFPSVLVFETDLNLDMTNGIANAANDAGSEFLFREYRTKMAQKAMRNISGFRANNVIQRKPTKESIAIVGMAFRLPGANNAEEFWNLLMAQGDAMQEVPANRWTPEQSCLVHPEDRKLKGGYLKDPIDEFDGNFFEISPAELSFVDPQQRFMLEMTWEALEDAAIPPSSLEGTNTGVFTGQWTFDYRELLHESGFRGNDIFRPYMGNGDGMTASRIAHFLGLSGRNIATESGCSSSMVAVCLAVQSLRNNESKIALVGGVNLLAQPYHYNSLKHLLSKNGHSKPFDESADGFARAEGCGVFILKRMSDAVKDHDRIYAVIKGYGVSQEGLSNSLGTPTIMCQVTAMRMALEDAEVQPHEVSFVEAHGTGTSVGDPLEVKAIASVYGEERTNHLVIGAVKANVGHTESCSGITGIIKTVLAFEHEVIPPQRQLHKLNSKINLDEIPAIIPLEPYTWSKESSFPRIAGVSSFGISGTDAHVILQEAPVQDNTLNFFAPKDELNIITFSAKTQDSLNILLNNYSNYLQKISYNIRDVAFTANTGRTHFKYRAAVVSRSLKDIIDSIQKQQLLKGSGYTDPNICFMFPGQIWEYQKLGQKLYSTNNIFKDHFDVCEKIIKSKTGKSIKDTRMWSETSNNQSDILGTELSIFTVQYCLFQLWKSLGVKPDCILGHNVGEYAAATVAEILKLDDAIILLEARSKFLINVPFGSKIVLNANEAIANKLVKEFQKTNLGLIEVAEIVTLQQTTLLGSDETIIRFNDFCCKKGTVATILEERSSFSSKHAHYFLEKFKNTARNLTYLAPKYNYISSVFGVSVDFIDAEYWVSHLTDKVLTHYATQTAISIGCNMFIELGSFLLLSESITRNNSVAYVESIKRDSDEHETIIQSLAKLYVKGVDILWPVLYSGKRYKKVPLPHYPFQKSKYWFDYEASTSVKQLGFHPLLGQHLQTAGNEAIYQNNFQLQTHLYIEDHKVGGYIIYPGSAYLEMTLMAGYASQFSSIRNFQFPETPIIIRDFLIIAALEIQSDKTVEFQTIVRKDNSVKKVKIYSRKRTIVESPWIGHSEGSFGDYKIDLKENTNISVADMKAKMAKVSEKTLYTHLSKLGYNFGPKFQSLKNIWRSESGVLAEINIPQEDNLCGHGYLCHPTATDAMLQATLILFDDQIECLHLPVSIKQFVFYNRPKEVPYYVYAKKDSEETIETVLINEAGSVFCSMKGVRFVKTKLTEFEQTFKITKNRNISILTEDWHITSSNPLKLTNPFCFERNQAELHSLIGEAKELIEVTRERQRLNIGISMKLLSLLLTMGWNRPSIDDIITADNIIKDLSIVETGHWLVGRFLEMLTEDGYLEKQTMNIKEFKMIKAFPIDFDLNLIVSENINGYQTGVFEHEWACASTFLTNMPKLLTGKVLPLSLLFPEDDQSFSAEYLYSESTVCVEMGDCLSKAVKFFLTKLLENVLYKNETIKFLEIGSGTGSFSNRVLPILDRVGIKYVYTFTDISSGFLPAARNKFKEYEENMEFLPLNIEKDPKLQGFLPNEYDVVMSSYALHATKDLNETLRNVRNLMKAFGLFLMTDTIAPQRHIDISFGLLEGYYCYKDKNLRPYHCLVSAETWTKLLLNNGFSSVCAFKRSADEHGLIIAEASEVKPQYKLPAELPERTWIIFHDGSQLSDALVNQLQLEDRNVFTVKPSQFFTVKSQFSLEIQISNKEDVEKLYSHVSSESNINNLEGVILLWSLMNTKDCNLSSQSLLYLMQTTLDKSYTDPPIIYIVTNGNLHVEDQEPIVPVSSTVLGMIKSFMCENSRFKCKIIDLDPSEESNGDKNIKSLVREIWKQDHEPIVACRRADRFVPRIKNLDSYLPPLTLPSSLLFQLELPKSNNINDLKFSSICKPLVCDNEVLVEVKAASLNFKDVLNVLRPFKGFGNFVGSDFSGIVIELGENVTRWNIGDRVLGGTFHSLRSHISLAEEHLISLPETMSYAEGCTLPTVFATAYHCLVTVAKTKAGDNVLIHTGSGGVGLCAIEICLGVGANIFTTASSKRKQTYLKNLGIKHVFSSRNLDFSKHILNLTNNKGVNVILNTLTGPGFKEASLDCCAVNGRFIEISKLNAWSLIEVSHLRKDVKYSVEDLAPITDFETWKGILIILDQYLNRNRISSIPFTQFCFLDIRRALKYLEEAHQIGKVVCVMPYIVQTKNALQITPMLFNDKGTYLVTGGTRGVGFEVSKWMLKFGAKHILLCSRSVAECKIFEEINAINTLGNQIVVKQCDVSNFEQCRVLLNYINNEMPKLRGIIHSAGCLSDGIIQNLTWENFEITINPKVNGAWNLHRLTKNLPLEHFIMFSSISSVFGSPGQSNHCAANSFLDAFAHYRKSIGLPATSVNWGQWGETGIVANRTVFKGGLRPFTNAQGLEALKTILTLHLTQAIAMDGEFSFFRDNFPWLRSYTDRMKDIGDLALKDNSLTNKVSAADFWNEINQENDANFRYKVVLKNVINVVESILKYRKKEQIDTYGDFRHLGVDSLMMIEIRNHLQVLVGKKFVISANDIADCSNIDVLSKKVIEIIFSEKISNVEADRKERNKVIREDAQLWHHIQANRTFIKASDVKSVLLVGATGFLGAYVLRNLSQRQQVLKIYCLLRGNTPKEQQHRLDTHLKELKIFHEINMDKVEIINGDITTEKFGFSREIYQELANEVDAIVNCSIYSNHLLDYPKRDSQNPKLRTVNVTGTQRVLEFACCKRTKLVYHSSSILAMWRMEGHSITEDWPEVGDFDDGINYGYAISKHVSDKLVHEAVTTRNIPCKVFRFPKVSGDSKSGRQFVEGDLFLLRLMHFMKTGCMPDIDAFLQLLPVDLCADISLDVFFKDGIPSDIFNVWNPHNQNEKLVYDIAKSYGRTVNLVSYEAFVEILLAEGNASLLYKWTEFYTKKDALFKLHENRECPLPMLDIWKICPENCFADSKIFKIFPQLAKSLESSLEILRRDVEFAVKNYPNIEL